MLSIIGLGLNDGKDITVRGLELVKQADLVFLEHYTSILQVNQEQLESVLRKKVILADRDLVEKRAEDEILAPAKEGNVAFLVVGDPMSATTHLDLIARAQQRGIPLTIVHNTSVMTAVADTGLSLYKFGKTASIPFWSESFKPESFFDVLEKNKTIDAHTLFLLDLRPDESKFMTVNEALVQLLGISKNKNSQAFTEDTLVIGCARLGTPSAHITSGSVKILSNHDFGPAPHCLIVPGTLHFTEEEALALHERT